MKRRYAYPKIWFILLVFQFTSLAVLGQKKMFMSYEIGLNVNVAKFDNPQQNVNYEAGSVAIPGFAFAREISQNWFAETGIYQGFLGADMLKKGEFDSTNVAFSQEQIHIPLRVQLRTELFDDHLHLYTTVGGNLVLSSGGYNFELLSAKNTTEIVRQQATYQPTYVLAELGVGFDLFLGKRFFLGARYRYNIGFKDILAIAVSTLTTGETAVEDYFLTSRGSFHAFMLGVGFRVGKLKKKQLFTHHPRNVIWQND